MDREGRLNLLIVVLTLFAIFAVPYVVVKTDVIAAVFSHNEVDCDGFEFDQEEWLDVADEEGRGEQAEGLAKCDSIVGLSRDEVRALLGDPRGIRGGRWRYFAGVVEGDFGYRGRPSLNVAFNHGRVTKVGLNPDPTDEPVLD